jgi:hypothetical protein
LRGKYLRELLSIEEISPLHSRDVRNHFEHYDEYLHEWAEKSNHKLMRRNIAAMGSGIRVANINEYVDMVYSSKRK